MGIGPETAAAYGKALQSSVVTACHRPPKESAFASLLVMAIDYSLGEGKSDKRDLFGKKREIIYKLLELTTVINDWWDEQSLDASRYIRLRREIRQMSAGENISEKYRQFFALIRKLESERPKIPLVDNAVTPQKVVAYRESSAAVLLALPYAVVYKMQLGELIEGDGKAVRVREDAPSNFHVFYWSILALQVIDDIVGRQDDVAKGRPTFYTAYFSHGPLGYQLAMDKLQGHYRDYLQRAHQADPVFSRPINLALSVMAAALPKLVAIARGLGGGFLHRFFNQAGLYRDLGKR